MNGNAADHAAGAKERGNEAASPAGWLRAAFDRFAGLWQRGAWRRERRGLRVCETLSFGNRGFLAVVRYRERQFLVGATNSSIALLAQLSPAPEPESESAEADRPAR